MARAALVRIYAALCALHPLLNKTPHVVAAIGAVSLALIGGHFESVLLFVVGSSSGTAWLRVTHTLVRAHNWRDALKIKEVL